MQLRTFLLTLGVVTAVSLTGAPTAEARSSSADKKSKTSDSKETKKVTYKVKPGDTLTKIADKYDKEYETTFVRIFNANKDIDNPDVINVGDKIRIPAKGEKLPDRFGELTKAAASAPAPDFAAERVISHLLDATEGVAHLDESAELVVNEANLRAAGSVRAATPPFVVGVGMRRRRHLPRPDPLARLWRLLHPSHRPFHRP